MGGGTAKMTRRVPSSPQYHIGLRSGWLERDSGVYPPYRKVNASGLPRRVAVLGAAAGAHRCSITRTPQVPGSIAS